VTAKENQRHFCGNTTFRYFASLPPGRFAPLDVSIPERFTTSLDASPPDDKEVLIVTQITNFQRNVQVANWQSSETPMNRLCGSDKNLIFIAVKREKKP